MDNGSTPEIQAVHPLNAIPGGDFHIHGSALAGADRPQVMFGESQAPIIIGSEEFVIARVPDGASSGELTISHHDRSSLPYTCHIGIQIADSVHPVANPAVDAMGNVYTTLSGSRGQKTPVSVYRVDTENRMKPFLSDLMNPTGVVLDDEGMLYVSSRHDGIIYQATAKGEMAVYVEGMGVATGLAFDKEGNLYVGDRSGTIFKIARTRQIYVFATIEPSIAAYHLAFDDEQNLYVTGPTTSSFDCVYRVSPDGHVNTFYRGLGRPQGLALDASGNVYVAASLGGRRGVIRITQAGAAELFLSGPSIVGQCFAPGGHMIVATTSALFRVYTGVDGRPLP
jgi:sugar lactone lactonase YvrE